MPKTRRGIITKKGIKISYRLAKVLPLFPRPPERRRAPHQFFSPERESIHSFRDTSSGSYTRRSTHRKNTLANTKFFSRPVAQITRSARRKTTSTASKNFSLVSLHGVTFRNHFTLTNAERTPRKVSLSWPTSVHRKGQEELFFVMSCAFIVGPRQNKFFTLNERDPRGSPPKNLHAPPRLLIANSSRSTTRNGPPLSLSLQWSYASSLATNTTAKGEPTLSRHVEKC